MKICIYGPLRRVGIVHDDLVVDANAAQASYLAATTALARPQANADLTVPATLNEFIAEGADALRAADLAVQHVLASGEPARPIATGVVFSLDQVQLHAPIEGASRVFAALANFADHMQAAASNTDDADAQATLNKLQAGGPKYFMKDARSASTDGDPVRYPARTSLLDYEAEVAVVIGGQGRDIAGNDFGAHIYGYVVANDWSVRDYVSFGPDFLYSKNFDTGTGLGPWIVVDDSIDPQDIAIRTTVNGEVRQDGNTASMIHTFAALGEFLSRDVTLYPGDLILSGTPKGTAVDSSKRLPDSTFPDDSKFVRPGDVVEVTSPQLGTLKNTIVKAG